MPLSFTHFIVPVAILKSLRRKINTNLLFFAGFGGILPDLDYIYFWIYNYLHPSAELVSHRTVGHNLFLPTLLLLIFLFMKLKNSKIANYGLVFTMGAYVHIFLDSISGKVPLFWPFLSKKYSMGLGAALSGADIWIYIETALLSMWLFYMWASKKMRPL